MFVIATKHTHNLNDILYLTNTYTRRIKEIEVRHIPSSDTIAFSFPHRSEAQHWYWYHALATVWPSLPLRHLHYFTILQLQGRWCSFLAGVSTRPKYCHGKHKTTKVLTSYTSSYRSGTKKDPTDKRAVVFVSLTSSNVVVVHCYFLSVRARPIKVQCFLQ